MKTVIEPQQFSNARYRARCLLCKWVSRLNRGPVFAGWDGLAHAKRTHPDQEGFIAVIEEIAV